MSAPEVGSTPVTRGTDIAFVCRIYENKWDQKAGVGQGLANLRQILEQYNAIGIPNAELHVSAIFHGEAAQWLLTDEAYGGREGGNPNKSIVRELIQSGVSIEACGQTMKEHGWTKKDLLPGVRPVPAAYPRLIDLEGQGYSYVSF